MKITIYELLGLVKDGKAPKKIKYQGYKWIWVGDDYKTIKGLKDCFLITGEEYTWVTEFLNDEVEIIEEEDTFEDIEETNFDVDCTYEWSFGECYDTINQLIRNQKKIISKLDKE